jgi:hypothetical protein
VGHYTTTYRSWGKTTGSDMKDICERAQNKEPRIESDKKRKVHGEMPWET